MDRYVELLKERDRAMPMHKSEFLTHTDGTPVAKCPKCDFPIMFNNWGFCPICGQRLDQTNWEI